MFHERQRVATLPHTDAFMQGDRYGDVRKVTKQYVYVEMDRSRRVRKFPPSALAKVD